MSWIWPDGSVCLRGGGVELVPLTLQHVDDLAQAAADSSEWEWDNGFVPRPESMHAYVSRALSERDAGRSFPFAVCLDTKRPIGTSWYRVYDTRRKKVEIGFTWYARSFRRSFVNRQTKLLLMSHAFETLACILVEFLVHVKNTPSRTAVTALGAQQDGFLRRVIPMKDGTFADVAVFSVADSEWPAVKERLAKSLERNRQSTASVDG
jgi:RimJ/RimL family protein N-acetyltransferase